jgi:hypothetical protein
MPLTQRLPTTFTMRILTFSPIADLDILFTRPSLARERRLVDFECYRGD